MGVARGDCPPTHVHQHNVDARRELPAGAVMEREIRACAVHACEGACAPLDVPPRTLDNWLWNRGTKPPYSERPAHLTPTVITGDMKGQVARA